MSANDELQAHTCEKILQEYGNVANNVAQGNSQDLTEQWEKGELEQGWYYVQLIRGEYRIDLYIKDKNEWIDCPDAIIDAVVCAVPSYEEWQQLVQDYGDKHDKYLRLSQTNHQLHKFLEEFNALDVAKENDKLKTENKWYSEQLNEAVKEVSQLKDVISKMCMELVDPDDDMSNGLAEYFNQDLLLEIHEVLK